MSLCLKDFFFVFTILSLKDSLQEKGKGCMTKYTSRERERESRGEKKSLKKKKDVSFPSNL